MTLAMFDSIDITQIPAGALAAAGYVDGRFANVAELRDRFPHAHILSIAVSAAHDADCLDIERGDATPGQAAGWYERQRARGITRPCLYASASLMNSQVIPVIRAAGITRSAVRLWSAHYTLSAHICGPASCGALSMQADGTQFTSRALGRNLDESLLADDFFCTSAPVPDWQVAIMNALPVLSQGAADTPGHVYFVHRMQALIACVGRIKGIPLAACVIPDGQFDAGTAAGLKAVQASFGLTPDGIAGPLTWAALVTGQHG